MCLRLRYLYALSRNLESCIGMLFLCNVYQHIALEPFDGKTWIQAHIECLRVTSHIQVVVYSLGLAILAYG